MNDTFQCGLTEMNGKKYAFFLNENLLTLVPFNLKSTKETFVDFLAKPIKLKLLKGITTSNHNICFFDLKLKAFGNKLITYISSYLIGENNLRKTTIEPFSSMMFTGEIVNKFLDPIYLKYDHENSIEYAEDGSRVIALKTYEDTTFEYDIYIENQKCRLTLSVTNPNSPTVGRNDLGKVNTFVRISTKNEWNINQVKEVYFSVLRFFEFVTFRKNIQFDKILLEKLGDNNSFETTARFHAFYNDHCTNNTKIVNYYNICNDIGKLFNELNSNQKYLKIIPANDEAANYVDYHSAMLTSALFEDIFSKKKHDYDMKDEKWIKAKQDVINAIDNIVDASDDELIEKYIKEIKEEIHMKDKETIKNKYKYVLKENKNIINHVFKNIDLNSEIINDLAYAFSKLRNNMAHGEIIALNELSSLEVKSYIIAICFIYIIILQKCNMDELKIKTILTNLFSHYM